MKPADPITLGLAVGLLAAVAVAASYIPARRASKFDPMTALRYEYAPPWPKFRHSKTKFRAEIRCPRCKGSGNCPTCGGLGEN